MDDQKVMDQLLTVEVAAKIMNVHTRTILRYIQEGHLKAYRWGPSSLIRIWRSDLLNSLELIKVGETLIDGEKDEEAVQGYSETWERHWFFNTNETHGPGAYTRMFEQGVIAIYGYDNGPENLEGTDQGDRVLAYVNQQGIRALGTVIDPTVKAGQGIFFDEGGNQQPAEFHVAVEWDVILPPEKALSSSEASSMGYNLPVRSVLAKLHKGSLAKKMEAEIIRRV